MGKTNVGCLGVFLFGIGCLVWYFIYKYVGHAPLNEDYCIYFECSFPKYYKRNWFGDIWIYSPLWLPVLLIFIRWAIKNWVSIKQVILAKKFKIIVTAFVVGLLFTIYLIVSPIVQEQLETKQTYDDALVALKEENYLLALSNFEEVQGYKDSKQQIDKIHSEILRLVPEMIEKEMFWDGYYLDEYLKILSKVSKYEKEANELKEIAEVAKTENLAETRAELRRTIPYEGMLEENISLSAWGPPTEIKKELHYDAMRVDRRVKHYKWIEEDEFGRIKTIKTLMVKQGAVWGEPSVSQYYQNN